jgi:hypothetical protein
MQTKRLSKDGSEGIKRVKKTGEQKTTYFFIGI